MQLDLAGHLRRTSQSAIARSSYSSLRNSSSHKVDQELRPRRHGKPAGREEGVVLPLRPLLRGTGVLVPPRPSGDRTRECPARSAIPELSQAGRPSQASGGVRRQVLDALERVGQGAHQSWMAWRHELLQPASGRHSERRVEEIPPSHAGIPVPPRPKSRRRGGWRDLHVCLPYETSSVETQTWTTV